MLHAKSQDYRTSGSGEEDFLKGFYHKWAWRPPWSCDPDAANELSSPLPIEAPQKWL